MEPAGLRHAVKSRIERPFLKTKHVLANLLDPESNCVPVHLAQGGQGVQHQQVKGAFKTIIGVCAFFP
jgi:hypothetical protein